MKVHNAAGSGGAATAGRDWKYDRRALFILALLALFIAHPLIAHGCSCGHDFDFHLVSWLEAATQISHGTLHPQWAYTPAWDAGEPRFVFYPPASWYLGALLGLLLTHLPGVSEASGWTAAPILFTWAALTLSGIAMYHLASRYAGAGAALIASAIYIANPYMLFTAYERTAYGELLAAAWMPLLLDSILRRRISAVRIAVPVALLWLTNAPAAVMGCYALALLAAARILFEAGNRRAIHNVARCVAGAALGLGLAAFYVVPAAYERRYVQTAMAMVGGMKIGANFLFERTGTASDDLLHDQVLRTASWIAVALLTATAAALIAARRRSRTAMPLQVPQLAALLAVIAFFLTPLSAPLWRLLPEMPFLQFPWRLLALLAPALALAIAVALPDSSASAKPPVVSAPSAKAALAALLAAAILGLPAWHLFRQACDPEDTAVARLTLFHSNAGTDPTDEYTPVTADNGALQPGHPSWQLADSADAGATTRPPASAARTAPMHLTVDAPRAEILLLNLRDYPAWRITLSRDNAAPQVVKQRAPRGDGLIAFPVAAGRSTIDIHYAQTPDRTVGDAISLFAFAALGAGAWRGRWRATFDNRPA